RIISSAVTGVQLRGRPAIRSPRTVTAILYVHTRAVPERRFGASSRCAEIPIASRSVINGGSIVHRWGNDRWDRVVAVGDQRESLLDLSRSFIVRCRLGHRDQDHGATLAVDHSDIVHDVIEITGLVDQFRTRG